MIRPGTAALVAVNVLLAGATLIVAANRSGSGHGREQAGGDSQRWATLPRSEQLALLREHRDLAARGEEGRERLRRAREFARLPGERQARLRSLMNLVDELLREQTAEQRRAMLRALERVRALLLFQYLQAHDPGRIKALRAEWAGD